MLTNNLYISMQKTNKYSGKIFLITILLVVFGLGFFQSVFAAPPLLHGGDLLLNGTWNFYPKTGGSYMFPVPEYWNAAPGVQNFNTDEATYERTVNVPAAWAGKVIKLEFGGVNHVAEVYVNNILVGEHIGGWIPFSFDISSNVSAGSSFQLKVKVKGANKYPILDGNSRPLWPVGAWGWQERWGFFSDVWMRSYGKVHIEDAHIKTSYRNKRIDVIYK
jgi:beta-galactosidase/beta-glucuronidase